MLASVYVCVLGLGFGDCRLVGGVKIGEGVVAMLFHIPTEYGPWDEVRHELEMKKSRFTWSGPLFFRSFLQL